MYIFQSIQWLPAVTEHTEKPRFRLRLWLESIKGLLYLMKLILASTSPYRKALMDRLQLEYECVTPEVEEMAMEDESIDSMVKRLARLKAHAVADQYKTALIIGSDQSAVLNGKPLTKPVYHENAVKQLQQASGQRIVFHTGLCVLNTKTGKEHLICEPYAVVFKELTDAMIENYLKKEEPYNCAGSFKSEGLGITLFEKFEGEDPNSLVGLPLIKLVEILEQEGVRLLD